MTDIADSAARLAGLRVIIIRQSSIAHDKRVQQIARLLARAGAEVEVLCVARTASTWPSPDGYLVREVWPGDPSEHPLWFVRVLRNVLRIYRQHRDVSDLIRRSPADVIHCMNVDALLVGWRGARGRSVIYSSREHFATTGHVRPWVRAWWLVKERVLVPRVAGVITVSQPIAEDLARRYKVRTPAVILNASAGVVTSPSEVHTPLRLLHLGKFFADRGLADLVRAAARTDVVLTLQGWGECEGALRSLSASLGVEDRVRIVGPCAPEEIPQLASAHDVGVIGLAPNTDSSRWAAPNKLFDYMGAGLALLVPDLPVMASIVNDHQCGLTYPAGNYDAMRDRIEEMASRPGDVARMKDAALQAAPSFTWDGQADRLYELYEGIRDRVSAQGGGRDGR